MRADLLRHILTLLSGDDDDYDVDDDDDDDDVDDDDYDVDDDDDDDVEVRWVGECMASVFQWDSRAGSIEFQWLIARQIHQLLNWE